MANIMLTNIMLIVVAVQVIVAIWCLYKIRINIIPVPPLPPERLFSAAEIAAKSIGYWEKRGLYSDNVKEKMVCVRGLLNAQRRLIALTGNYVPEEAKTILSQTPSPSSPLSEEGMY